MIKIRFATSQDYDYLVHNDRHIKPEVVEKKIEDAEIIVVLDNAKNIGWLRFNYFWDEIPFMNMLWIEEDYEEKELEQDWLISGRWGCSKEIIIKL